MAITAGTTWYAPIDFGISEGLSNLFGTQIGAYNPAQNIQPIGQETVQNYPGAQLSSAVGGGTIQGPMNQRQLTQVNSSGENTSASDGGGGSVDVPQDNTGPSIWDEINSLYDAAMGYAGQAESAIRGAQPGVEDTINRSAQQSTDVAGSQKAAGDRTINEAETSSLKRFQNAMADARQALMESRMGAQQRFGRASDIGRALGEYATVNFQRAASATKDTYENTKNKIMSAKLQLEDDYKNTITQINNWKAEQLANAQREFQNKLLEIANMRVGAEGDRSNQRISALQNLSAQIQSIQSAALEYATQAGQNANAMLQQISNNTRNMMQTYGGQATSADTGFSNYLASAKPSQQQVLSAGQAPATYTPTGYKRDDEYLA